VSVENNFAEWLAQSAGIMLPPINPPAPAPRGLPAAVVASTPELPPLTPIPPIFERIDYGSGGAIGHTWHLSVIDGGHPRGAQPARVVLRGVANTFDVFGWTGIDLTQGQWKVHQGEGEQDLEALFGHPRAIPVVGDFNGDGVANLGVYIDGEWFIDLNGNGRWDAGDLWARLGTRDDQPVVGDWDGDGKDDIGIFGPAWPGDPKAVAKEPGLPAPANVNHGLRKNFPPAQHEAALGVRTMKPTAHGNLRADLIDHVFHYGVAGDRAVVGDWNGDGIDTIGVFRDGTWWLDVDGDGRFTDRDRVVQFGQAGDIPVVGDWNGNGITNLGVYRQGRWILDTNGNRQIDPGDLVVELGGADDLPVVGDFNGDGRAQIGLYRGGPADSAAE
jgi:serine-aspartate repeat-containing protein C/D/E